MNTERTIMVADTKTQKKYKITTNASTLGELKQCLSENGIDYSGMAFTEGITKSTLTEDNAPLPTNIPYKGSTTNNLVLLLTNTRKNIASGMNRKEAYGLIKQHGLQDTVKAKYGRNFTQVPTDDLEDILVGGGYINTPNSAPVEQKEITSSIEEVKDSHTPINMYNDVLHLIFGLADNGILTTDDLEDLADEIREYEPSTNSALDIDAMMAAL